MWSGSARSAPDSRTGERMNAFTYSTRIALMAVLLIGLSACGDKCGCGFTLTINAITGQN
jgi:hypothetical protein